MVFFVLVLGKRSKKTHGTHGNGRAAVIVCGRVKMELFVLLAFSPFSIAIFGPI